MVKRLGVLVLFLSLCLGFIAVVRVQAAGCSVDSFSASPGGSVTVGDTVTFYRSAHCDGVGLRAIRQTLNGNPWGEYGGPSDTRTWNTGAEYGAGTYHICLQVAESGNDSWSGVAQSCFDYTVSPKNQQGQIPQCTISVNPSSNLVVAANTPVGISANGSCSTGVRAMRVLLNDQPQYELGSSSINWTWYGSGPSNTLWRICAQVAGQGDDSWSYKAESCFTIQVEDQGHPVEPIAPPVSNGGTTANSGGFSQYRLGSNGLDVQGYCSGKFGVQATNDGINAASWDCAGHHIDHDQVCRDIWGDSRPYAWLQGGLAGWTCEQSPQPGGSGNVSPPSGGSDPKPVQDGVGYSSPHSQEWVKIITGKLNLRSGPGTNYEVVAKAPFGAYLDYISSSNGWYQVSFGSVQGWVAGGASYTQRGSGPDTGAQAPVGPAQPQNLPQQSSCGVAPVTRLQIGQQGRNTYGGGSTNVRSVPRGTSIYVMPEGEIFTVLAGPECHVSGTDGNLNWWQIQLTNGMTGWAPEGGKNGYWLEPYSSPQEVTQNPQQNWSYENVNISGDAWGHPWSFVFQYNSSTNTILNGNEFISWEINRLWDRLAILYDPCPSVLYSTCKDVRNTAFLQAFLYNAALVGEADSIRKQIQSVLCASGKDMQPCPVALRYKVGDQMMDMAGPANVTFGFICEWMQIEKWKEDKLSDAEQTLGTGVVEHRYVPEDFPDDQNQRLMGHNLFKITGQSNPSVSGVAQAANMTRGLNRP